MSAVSLMGKAEASSCKQSKYAQLLAWNYCAGSPVIEGLAKGWIHLVVWQISLESMPANPSRRLRSERTKSSTLTDDGQIV